MKKKFTTYPTNVSASTCLNASTDLDLRRFPEGSYGSAPEGSSKNSGWIKFGAGRSLELPNGISIYLTTGKVMANSETGEITNYLNFEVYPHGEFAGRSFYKITAEEFTKIYRFLASISEDQFSEYFEKSTSMFDKTHWR